MEPESNGKLVFEGTCEYIKDDESPISETHSYHHLKAQGVLRYNSIYFSFDLPLLSQIRKTGYMQGIEHLKLFDNNYIS